MPIPHTIHTDALHNVPQTPHSFRSSRLLSFHFFVFLFRCDIPSCQCFPQQTRQASNGGLRGAQAPARRGAPTTCLGSLACAQMHAQRKWLRCSHLRLQLDTIGASPPALVIATMSQGGLSDPIEVARRSHHWTHPADRHPCGTTCRARAYGHPQFKAAKLSAAADKFHGHAQQPCKHLRVLSTFIRRRHRRKRNKEAVAVP